MPEFRGRKFTDERLRSLIALERFRSLSLCNTSVTDQGILALAQACKLEEIHIVSDILTDDCMPTLCSLRHLRSLLLDGLPRVTDGGVAAIANAYGLRELYLNGTQVTDNGLRRITHLKDLRSLCLNDTSVSDHGVRALSSLASLTLLTLNRTNVTGSGFASVANNEHFRLYLAGSAVDDDGVRVIASQLTNLMGFDLSNTRVTDQSLSYLLGLPKLNDLRLWNTDISDEGIQLLHNHPSLGAIYIDATKVSSKGIEDLKHKLPGLMVFTDP